MLSFSVFVINRPRTAFARPTLTDTDFCLRDRSSRKASTRQACGGKTSNPAKAGSQLLICLKGMRVLPGQVARANVICLRYVCVGLRLIDTHFK